MAPPLVEEEAAPVRPAAPPPVQAEEKPRPRRRKRKPKSSGFWRQLTKGQRVVLSLLGIAVLIIYLLLGWAVWSSSRQAAAPPTEIPVVVPQETPMTTWEATPQAEEEADDEETIQPTPTPSPTPMAVAVSTKYDLQVYQHPDDIELRLKRGFEYLHLRACEAAIADFEHVLELDAKNAQAYVGLGEAYFCMRRWKEAESAFGTAISFDEHSEEAHYNLGYLYYWWGHYRPGGPGQFACARRHSCTSLHKPLRSHADLALVPVAHARARRYWSMRLARHAGGWLAFAAADDRRS